MNTSPRDKREERERATQRPMMIEQTLFPLAAAPDPDLERTGGMSVAVDETFSTATRIRLDDTSWVDHVQGWLTGDAELMEALMKQAGWEQRSRWMYTQMVTEPRLTAEYPVIDEAPQPVLHYLTEVLSAHYERPYTRLWMNWYRDNNDGTGWHADRPQNQLAETVIPVLSLGATRRFLIRPEGGGPSTAIVTHGGDLVVMGGRCQKDYEHSVPKQKQYAGPRVSLNFSTAIPPGWSSRELREGAPVTLPLYAVAARDLISSTDSPDATVGKNSSPIGPA